MQNRSAFSVILVLLLVIIGLLLYNNCTRKVQPAIRPATTEAGFTKNSGKTSTRIDALTAEKVVVPFVKNHGKLPDYYITKKEAREKGWSASNGNLCDVLPGKAIGGDVFTNREGKLPTMPGRTWFEADLNYNCGRRNAHRLVFSNDGLVYVTHDHYKSFEKK